MEPMAKTGLVRDGRTNVGRRHWESGVVSGKIKFFGRCPGWKPNRIARAFKSDGRHPGFRETVKDTAPWAAIDQVVRER